MDRSVQNVQNPSDEVKHRLRYTVTRIVHRAQRTRVVQALKRLKRPFALWPVVVRLASPFRSRTRHLHRQSQLATGPRLRAPAWALLALLFLGAGVGFSASAIMGQLGAGHGSNQPDFTLASNPATLNAPQGQVATFSVSMNSINGFAGSVNLNVSANPNIQNATYNLNPTSVSLFAGSGLGTLTIDVSSTTPVRDYFLILSGSSGRLNHSVTIILEVTPPPQPNFQIQSSLSTINVTQGTTVSNTITLISIGSFSGIVNMSATISPSSGSSPTLSLNPNKVTLLSGGTASVVLTITTTGTTNRGAYWILVQGISGGLSNTTTINLMVQ